MKVIYKYVLVIAWMTLIFFLSAEGAHDSKARSGVIVGVLKDSLSVDFAEDFLSFLTRKAAHIIAYFVLGLLLYSVIKTHKLTSKRTIMLSILCAFLYAVSDEIHQLFIPGRSGEIRDVFIDTASASTGVYLYYLCNKIHYTSTKRKHSV